jgi:beta-catenin-like protein 1
LGELSGDGVDDLLQAAAYYRKRQPASAEEAELVENLFASLASALTTRENQGRFRHSQGFELMVRCMKEKNHAGTCALKVLDFATQNNPANSEAFVASGGLKVLFPAFMGRGVVHALSRRGKKGASNSNGSGRSDDKAEAAEAEAAAEASAVSVVATLCLQLQLGGGGGDKTAGDALPRLVAKFLEDGAVKVCPSSVRSWCDFAGGGVS